MVRLLPVDLSKLATQRVRIRRVMNAALSELDTEGQLYVLHELIAERAIVPSFGPVEPITSEEDNEPPRLARRGKPPVLIDKLVNALRAHPRGSSEVLAKAVYGETSDAAKGRIRNMLAIAHKGGRIKNVGYGQWEAIDSKP